MNLIRRKGGSFPNNTTPKIASQPATDLERQTKVYYNGRNIKSPDTVEQNNNLHANGRIVQSQRPKNPTQVLLHFMKNLTDYQMPELAQKFNTYMEGLPTNALEYFKGQMVRHFDYLYDLSESCNEAELNLKFLANLKKLDHVSYARKVIAGKVEQEINYTDQFNTSFKKFTANPSLLTIEEVIKQFEASNPIDTSKITNPLLKAAIERKSKQLLVMAAIRSVLADQFNPNSENFVDILDGKSEKGQNIRSFLSTVFETTLIEAENNNIIQAIKNALVETKHMQFLPPTLNNDDFKTKLSKHLRQIICDRSPQITSNDQNINSLQNSVSKEYLNSSAIQNKIGVKPSQPSYQANANWNLDQAHSFLTSS